MRNSKFAGVGCPPACGGLVGGNPLMPVKWCGGGGTGGKCEKVGIPVIFNRREKCQERYLTRGIAGLQCGAAWVCCVLYVGKMAHGPWT